MKKNKFGTLLEDFKKFINRGNVVDMAVGVIMGGAFGAIVTGFTNILMTLCTWGVPGGLSGLITVLPALNPTQKVPAELGLDNVLTTEEWLALPNAATQSLFKTYGGSYVYKGSPVLDWGVLINAIISFLIIAIVLFVILKVYNVLRNKKAVFEAKKLEKYYSEHPEERPLPPEEAPKLPTELDVLNEIRDLLKESK